MTTINPRQIEVYLEIGRKKVFAGTLDWPGWSRSARDEDESLAALAACGARYAEILSGTTLGFTSPHDPGAFSVIERLEGNSTTDFGAPDRAPARDAEPFDEEARERADAILAAIWRAFDRAVEIAEGKELRKGPRGGGRDLQAIVRHVIAADAGYLRRVGQRGKPDENAPLTVELQRTRAAIQAALGAGVRGEILEQGSRGGIMWTPRYFVRRAAWHAVDHLWEIEDRIM